MTGTRGSILWLFTRPESESVPFKGSSRNALKEALFSSRVLIPLVCALQGGGIYAALSGVPASDHGSLLPLACSSRPGVKDRAS